MRQNKKKKYEIELTFNDIKQIIDLMHDGVTLHSSVNNLPEESICLEEPKGRKTRVYLGLELIEKVEMALGKTEYYKDKWSKK